MAIDGLIILEPSGRPIIQTNFRTTSPVYPLLHIDAFNDALAKSPNGQLDPVIYISGHQGPSACCHTECGDLKLLCPVSGDIDPLYVFAFLSTFVDVLSDYLGEVSTSSIREHFDVVYQLLEEMLDDGHPLTTERNALSDIVLPPSLLNKILSVTGVSGLSKASATPFSSPIPWRKAGVRYNNNEIYFDVVEDLRAIVNKSGTVLSSNAWGRIESNSRLSGTPDLVLSFLNPTVLQDCSFHSCVRLQRWIRDKSLSFVPPDGRFVLMEYRHGPSSSTTLDSTRQLTIPFALSPSITIQEHGGSFDLSVTSRISSKPIEQLVVELYLGEGATSANCLASGGASWGFDPKTLTLRWELSKITQGSTNTLRGTFTSSASPARPSRAFRITFDIPQHSFSGVKVDKLKVAGENFKVFKGVRGRSTGDIEWRW
ncbi:clathrin adaptor, mu subunit [Rickenella mellea]|uniref:Clathrin adaptor, mu subunit n=1 Tax=Rickenella mellea TaxID=50990 RepID=A0A4R5XH94_9AGAM|nr:clathrin adaptor, mu subunit [Rickenella mellea]